MAENALAVTTSPRTPLRTLQGLHRFPSWTKGEERDKKWRRRGRGGERRDGNKVGKGKGRREEKREGEGRRGRERCAPSFSS